MQRHTQNLLTAVLGASALALISTPSFALGLPDPLNYDMGPLGNWQLSGGISGFAAGWNNNIPNTPSASERDGLSGDLSLDNAMIILNKTDGQLQFTTWVGTPPNTPVMGYNSPNVGPSLNAFGNPVRNPFGHGSPLFKGWATYQPVDWFNVQAGRLPSPDGTEVGVDWFNPTAFLSDLNNMQTTTADGGQVNFIAGTDKAFYGLIPGYGSTLTIRLADGYKTGHVNELGFTGLWNLNPGASDFIVAFGHTRLSPVGNVTGNASNGTGFVAGFGTVNADLIGIGGAYVLGNWTISPELQYQWLPKDSVAASNPNRPLTTYSNIAGQVTVTYQIDQRWSIGSQVQYIAQSGSSTDPNRDAFGNFLGLNTVGAGTFGAKANMFGVQINPTWQYHNFFIRPAIAYTRLSNFEAGRGYGKLGTAPDQIVGLFEIGLLIGQRAE